MTQVTRLDIQALITLVDEEELYNALNDENTYYWYGYHNISEFCTEATYHRFKCKINPMKYLIFTDEYFCTLLLCNIQNDIMKEILADYETYKNNKQQCIINYDCDEYFNNYKVEDLGNEVVIDMVYEKPIKYAVFFWNYISNLSISQLCNIFCAPDNANKESVICILNNKMEHIMPFNQEVPGLTDKIKKIFKVEK